MKLLRRTTVAVTVIAAGFLHVAQPVAAASHEHQTRSATESPGVVASPAALPAVAAMQLAQLHDYVAADTQAKLVDYANAVQRANVETYVNAVAAADAAAQSQWRTPASSSGSVSGGGSCYGGPIPDYIVTRESGGNPAALNPSGAWGCYQIMPEWWSGACSGFDRYTIDGQKQCAAILWNGGAGSGNWALTR